MAAELKAYKDECMRLRILCEQYMKNDQGFDSKVETLIADPEVQA